MEIIAYGATEMEPYILNPGDPETLFDFFFFLRLIS